MVDEALEPVKQAWWRRPRAVAVIVPSSVVVPGTALR